MSDKQADSFISNEITNAITKEEERQGCRKRWTSRNLVEKGSAWFAIICSCALITLVIVFSRNSNESSTAGVVTDVSTRFLSEVGVTVALIDNVVP
mmetsp:Transcript_24466/g.27451  ORF Transcript_24466/g.27451 Transcript_24466/m.27451 type:complete len:96 (+) Transcript_24466:59-346(+)